jgi:hypothetical protein
MSGAVRLRDGTYRLRDGSIGYCPRSSDDCWPAAIATVLQVPIDQLPLLGIDDGLRAGMRPTWVNRSASQAIHDWMTGRGLRMVDHLQVPIDAERWIGVVPIEGWFQSHCLVMSAGELLFDPAQHLRPAAALADPAARPDLLRLAALLRDPHTRFLLQDPETAKEVAPRCWTWGSDDVRYGFSFEPHSTARNGKRSKGSENGTT